MGVLEDLPEAEEEPRPLARPNEVKLLHEPDLDLLRQRRAVMLAPPLIADIAQKVVGATSVIGDVIGEFIGEVTGEVEAAAILGRLFSDWLENGSGVSRMFLSSGKAAERGRAELTDHEERA